MNIPVTFSPMLDAMVTGTLNGVRNLLEHRNVVPGVVLMHTPTGLVARHSASSVSWNDPLTVVRSIELLRTLVQQSLADTVVLVIPNYAPEPDAPQPSSVVIYVETVGGAWEGGCDVTRTPSGMLELAEVSHMFPSSEICPEFTDSPSIFWPMLNHNAGQPLPGRTHSDSDTTPQGAD